MEEELIEIVRHEKCLYDVKHPHYTKVLLKDAIWKRIAETLNLKDGHTAKRSWEKLRNNHRDALRRQHRPKTGNVVIKPWRFQEHMEFLIPYMANRDYANVREETHNEESSQPTSDNRENYIQENFVDIEEFKNIFHEETKQSTQSEKSFSDKSIEPVEQVPKRKRVKRNILNRSIKKHNSLNNRQIKSSIFNATTNENTVNNLKNDPLFHFFMSMYETTIRLPPIAQHNIKINLFSLVSQEESKYLLKSSPQTNTSN